MTFDSYRQYRRFHVRSLPDGVAAVVSEDDFHKANAYGISKIKFGMVRSVFFQVHFTAVIYYDGLSFLWNQCAETLRLWGYGEEYEASQLDGLSCYEQVDDWSLSFLTDHNFCDLCDGSDAHKLFALDPVQFLPH